MNLLKNVIRTSAAGLCAMVALATVPSANAFWPFSKSKNDPETCKANFEQEQENLKQSKSEFRTQCDNVSNVVSKLKNELDTLEKLKKASEKLVDELEEAYAEWSYADYRIDTPVYSKYVGIRLKIREQEDIVAQQRAVVKQLAEALTEIVAKDAKIMEQYNNSLNNVVAAYYNYNLAVAQENIQ